MRLKLHSSTSPGDGPNAFQTAAVLAPWLQARRKSFPGVPAGMRMLGEASVCSSCCITRGGHKPPTEGLASAVRAWSLEEVSALRPLRVVHLREASVAALTLLSLREQLKAKLLAPRRKQEKDGGVGSGLNAGLPSSSRSQLSAPQSKAPYSPLTFP